MSDPIFPNTLRVKLEWFDKKQTIDIRVFYNGISYDGNTGQPYRAHPPRAAYIEEIMRGFTLMFLRILDEWGFKHEDKNKFITGVSDPSAYFQMDEKSGRLVARTLYQEELDELKKEEE